MREALQLKQYKRNEAGASSQILDLYNFLRWGKRSSQIGGLIGLTFKAFRWHILWITVWNADLICVVVPKADVSNLEKIIVMDDYGFIRQSALGV